MNIGTYALKSFRHNAAKGIVFMIALSVMLVIAVLNISTTIQKTMLEQAVSAGGDAHIQYRYITPEQAAIISGHESVEWADLWLVLRLRGYAGDKSVSLSSSSRCGQMAGFRLVSGHAPQAENEAALPPHTAKLLGIDAKVGERFTLPVGERGIAEESLDFVVSGVIQAQPYQAEQEGFYIFVSEAFALKHGVFSEERDYSGFDMSSRRQLFVHFKDGCYPTSAGRELAELAGVKESDYSYNYDYLYAGLNSPDFVIVIGIILLILLATGALVIHNTFGMLAVRRTRSYGLLTLIGASKRQIRACIYIEALLDMAVALPIGLLLGTGFSYIGMPLIENTMNERLLLVISFAPWAYGLTALLAVVMTFIGVARPARKASRVTPVEAVRFSGAVEMNRKRRQENHLTTAVMARLNMKRNSGRTVRVILSLSISGVLLLSLSTVGVSMLTSADNITRMQVADDIQIFIGAENVIMPGSMALTQDIVDTLKGMDGVERVRTFMQQGYCTEIEIRDDVSYPAAGGNIAGMEDDTLRELLPLVADGTPDWDTVHDGINVLAVNWTDEYAVHYGQFNYELGQEITAYLTNESGLPDGRTVTLRVAGILNNQDVPPYINSWGALPKLIMPQSCFEANGFYCTYQSASLVIDSAKHDTLAAAIDAMCKQSGELYYVSYFERVQEYEQEAFSIIALVFMILAIIALVSILNLASSTFIGVEQRQREFGVLSALGLSPKGLRGLLTREGVTISAISVFVSTVLGLSGGYGLYLFLTKNTGASYMSYSFPIVPLVVLCLTYGIVPYLVTLTAVRRLSRKTTVELLGQET